MEAIILARISSKEQREGHSLDAQVKKLKQYCTDRNLKVIKTYQMIESSTKRHRPEFDKMIDHVRSLNKRIAIVVDTVDRLQRSFRETPIFNELMQDDVIELHFIKEGNILSKDATSSQKLMWNMGVVMTQSYTDQLSDNVKRSFDYKVKNGEWVAQAPLGYKNAKDPITGKSTIILDSDSASLLKKFFVEYATGRYSFAELVTIANGWGLRTRNRHYLRPQYMHRVIRNPFYYGVMIIKDVAYNHKYEPLIPKSIFDQCQRVLKNRSRNQKVKTNNYPYLYRGVFKCAVTGKRISCDLKKGKYIYIIATNPEDAKKKLYIPEQTVSKYILRKLKRLRLTDTEFNNALHYLNSSTNTGNNDTLLHKLRKERNDIQNKIDHLADLLIDNAIDRDIYKRKHIELSRTYSDKTVEINVLRKNDSVTSNKAIKTIIYISKNAYSVFKSSKTILKRELLFTLFSNCELHGSNIHCTTVLPLCLMLNNGNVIRWQCL